VWPIRYFFSFFSPPIGRRESERPSVLVTSPCFFSSFSLQASAKPSILPSCMIGPDVSSFPLLCVRPHGVTQEIVWWHAFFPLPPPPSSFPPFFPFSWYVEKALPQREMLRPFCFPPLLFPFRLIYLWPNQALGGVKACAAWNLSSFFLRGFATLPEKVYVTTTLPLFLSWPSSRKHTLFTHLPPPPLPWRHVVSSKVVSLTPSLCFFLRFSPFPLLSQIGGEELLIGKILSSSSLFLFFFLPPSHCTSSAETGWSFDFSRLSFFFFSFLSSLRRRRREIKRHLFLRFVLPTDFIFLPLPSISSHHIEKNRISVNNFLFFLILPPLSPSFLFPLAPLTLYAGRMKREATGVFFSFFPFLFFPFTSPLPAQLETRKW